METRLSSGPPWHLECDVQAIGDDYLCRIHGGDRHIGAVALSQWGSSGAETKCLTVSKHKERGIAIHAAHTLCVASRSSVSCIAGIHFEPLTKAEIAEIVRAAYALARRAAGELEQRRIEEALEAPDCPLARIAPTAAALLPEVEAFMDLPLARAVHAAGPRAAATVAENFGGRVCLFAPLYLSNACSNECVYCGFRNSARFRRMRLSIPQAVLEAQHLVGRGHRTIDLVTGEIANDDFVDYVCEAIRAILDATDIHRINLNLGALSTEQFRRLRNAGAGGYHLYQETYAPRTYVEVHGRGQKRDMVYRLGAPHRAARAGFSSLGLGILLGLHPIREDLAALAGHAGILVEDFPDLRIGFSLPRLQRADPGCEYTAAAPADDDDLVKAMLFLRLQFPSANLTLTTRERPEIRDRLIPLGVTKLSAGVSTAPGGYTFRSRSAAAQFDISDPRSLPEIVEVVQRSGLTAVYE
jgi:2-iminoacetate synthase